MRRCLNKTWLSARFGEAASPDKVEVIVGRPCDQLVFFWSDGGVTKSWGSVVSSAISEAFDAIVSGG